MSYWKDPTANLDSTTEQQGNPNKSGESLPPQNLMKGISNACTLEQEEVSSDGMSEMQKE